jgi:hypothetical protein
VSSGTGVSQHGPTDDPVVDRDKQASSGAGLLSWLALLAIGTCTLTLAAAHLPPVFKKLGLFAIAYGSLLGLAGAWRSQFAPGLRTRRGLGMAVVFVFALAGQIGIAAESYRIDRTERERRERSDPKRALANRLLESAAEPSDAKSQAALAELRRAYSSPGDSFGDYLQFRVSGIGVRSKRVAAWFWAIELLLGGQAAVWAFCRWSRAPALPARPRAAELDAAGAPAKLEE